LVSQGVPKSPVVVRVKPGPQPKEERIKQALETAGLSGARVSEASKKVLATVENDPAAQDSFEKSSSEEATKLLREPEFAPSVAAHLHLTEKGNADDRPVWPIFVAAAAFLYLWWLAALLFDLTVAWHHYIRNAAILDRLHDINPLT
jgi:hypothetical protein